MINDIVQKMVAVITKLENAIKDDIEDIKLANHERLLDRNDQKQQDMDTIVELKNELNTALLQVVKRGEDVNNYRDIVNNLENRLKELYVLNGKLASIVLPVRQMYSDIVEDLMKKSGGNIFEVKA